MLAGGRAQQSGGSLAEVERIDHAGWAEVILNRPARRNAINGPLGECLADTLRAVDADDDARLVLLRGADGAFCSGLDLKSFNAVPAPDWLPRFNTTWRGVHKALFECRKPIVAALERYAINGGAALALAADLLIVGETAFLQVGEVKMGMAAPYNTAWLRLRHSENVTAKLTITGRRFPGRELAELGVAYRSVGDGAVVDTARELAQELAGYPAGALQRIKATMRAYSPTDADAWFDCATNVAAGSRRSLRKQIA